MNIDTFREEIESYLPIDFYDEDNNQYKAYLLAALSENWDKEKYQFSLLAANMLFMTCIYKHFFYLKNKNCLGIAELIEHDNKFNTENLFALWEAAKNSEKNYISHTFPIFKLDGNFRSKAETLIHNRDMCAHANGYIHVKIDDIKFQFRGYITILNKCFDKNCIRLLEHFYSDVIIFLLKNLDINTAADFVNNYVKINVLSFRDVDYIAKNFNYDDILKKINISEERKEFTIVSLIMIKYFLFQICSRYSDISSDNKTLQMQISKIILGKVNSAVMQQLDYELSYVSNLWENDLDFYNTIQDSTLDEEPIKESNYVLLDNFLKNKTPEEISKIAEHIIHKAGNSNV